MEDSEWYTNLIMNEATFQPDRNRMKRHAYRANCQAQLMHTDPNMCKDLPDLAICALAQ